MQSYSFGAWVKERRHLLRLTQTELADRIGCAAVTIQKLETGKRRPSRQIAELLADKLQLGVRERALFLEAAGPQPDLALAEMFGRGALPQPLTSFIGREHDVEAVAQLVQAHPLVTLTGPGGGGKTRLAAAVAAGMCDHFTDGLAFVDLATVSEASLVPRAVAFAIGLPELPQHGLVAAVARYLRAQNFLLLLDNCEHLLEACSLFVDFCLPTCPRLHVLATSRQALALAYESAWPVPPLALPERYLPADVESLAGYSAVQLFVQRAQSRHPSFSLNERNAGSVFNICRRLDGLPLAIELAAVRVNVLSVEQIAARLDERFRLLVGGSESAPARQRTLKTAFDWSYQLLTTGERTLLQRLSVFAESFSLEAIHSVCGEGDDEYETIELLSGLADKSLVTRLDQAGGLCYRLLETIKQYAWEELRETGATASVRDKHLAWCLRYAEQAASRLKGPEQLDWLVRLEREMDNFRAALAWSLLAPRAAQTGLRLATALGWFWNMRSYLVEGSAWFGRLLAAPGNVERTALRSKALYHSGTLACGQHATEAARPQMEESLAIARELADPLAIARALSGMTMLAHFAGSTESAGTYVSEGLALSVALGRRWDVAWHLTGAACIALSDGEMASAAVQFEENIALYNELGDAWASAVSRGYQGALLFLQGRHEEARERMEQTYAINDRFGDTSRAVVVLLWLARIALAQEALPAAAELYRRVLASYYELGDQYYALCSLCGLARIAQRGGDPRRAATLWGVVAAVNPNHYNEPYTLEGAPDGTAGVPGATMSLDEAVEYGLRSGTSGGHHQERAFRHGQAPTTDPSAAVYLRRRTGLALLQRQQSFTSSDYIAATGAATRTAQHDLQALVRNGRLITRGNTRAMRYCRGPGYHEARSDIQEPGEDGLAE